MSNSSNNVFCTLIKFLWIKQKIFITFWYILTDYKSFFIFIFFLSAEIETGTFISNALSEMSSLLLYFEIDAFFSVWKSFLFSFFQLQTKIALDYDEKKYIKDKLWI